MGELVRLQRADEQMLNSLSALCATVNTSGLPFEMGLGAQASQADTLFLNNRWYLLSNLRQLLTQLYVEHGIVQTLVEQPVDDAWRTGFEVKSGQLDGNDIEKLLQFDEENQVHATYAQGRKWARLYGGGGVLILTEQNPALPLDLTRINPQSKLEFRDVDMWELYFSQQNVQATLDIGGALGENMGDHFDYYGMKVHKSRVLVMKGKKCPSFMRPRLRGWGMSELERLVRSLNQYMKNQDVIFSLLDEAKVDVYQIKGFNASLLTPTGTAGASQRIQMSNQIKSFNNALVMDKDDEYTQKQISFSGLSEVLLQIRQGLAADLKMPMTKLFGISASGFNSGEDDIENYNAMCESEIRKKDKHVVVKLLQICCLKVFGTPIDDLTIIPNPLRELNAKEEQEVKTSKFNRVMEAYTSGLVSSKETKEAINKDSLLPVEIDPNAEPELPIGGNDDQFDAKGGATGGAGKNTPAEA